MTHHTTRFACLAGFLLAFFCTTVHAGDIFDDLFGWLYGGSSSSNKSSHEDPPYVVDVYDDETAAPSSVPEPGSLLLIILGGAALIAVGSNARGKRQ